MGKGPVFNGNENLEEGKQDTGDKRENKHMGSIAYGRRFGTVRIENQPDFNRATTIDRW